MLAVYLYKFFVGMIVSTCRVKVHGLNTFIETSKKGRCALIFWHDRLGIMPAILNKAAPELEYLAVLSGSRDGRILGKLATSYKQCSALYVPHDTPQVALKKILEEAGCSKKVLVLTPDGPRGPRHVLKPGIAVIALRMGTAVVPLHWKSSKQWNLNSWDRMAFPKPFSSIDVFLDQPLAFDSRKNLSEVVETLQTALSK